MNNGYQSSAASLFAVVARADLPPDPLPKGRGSEQEEPVFTCPWCLSEDTRLVDKQMDIVVCANCERTFSRP